jgi:hypothetical protein
MNNLEKLIQITTIEQMYSMLQQMRKSSVDPDLSNLEQPQDHNCLGKMDMATLKSELKSELSTMITNKITSTYQYPYKDDELEHMTLNIDKCSKEIYNFNDILTAKLTTQWNYMTSNIEKLTQRIEALETELRNKQALNEEPIVPGNKELPGGERPWLVKDYWKPDDTQMQIPTPFEQDVLYETVIVTNEEPELPNNDVSPTIDTSPTIDVIECKQSDNEPADIDTTIKRFKVELVEVEVEVLEPVDAKIEEAVLEDTEVVYDEPVDVAEAEDVEDAVVEDAVVEEEEVEEEEEEVEEAVVEDTVVEDVVVEDAVVEDAVVEEEEVEEEEVEEAEVEVVKPNQIELIIEESESEKEVETDVEEEVQEEVVEEDAEEEVFEIEIDDVTYYATSEENGILYEMLVDGEIGKQVGVINDGEPIFNA